jgi:histidine triad (HIT) family protein
MNCLFCKIIKKEIPADIIFENEELLVFNDINPQAPKHLLVIPKRHIASINDANIEDAQLIGKMILTAKQIAANQDFSNSGYRLVFNINDDGGQTVYHTHLHILAGRKMTWPPG